MYNSPDNVYSDDLTTPKRTKWRAHWAICGAACNRVHFIHIFRFFHQKQQLCLYSSS